MNALEWRVAFSLSAVYAVRMLGLFMVLPVFALYVDRLPGATAALTGLAIGAYGFTQALLQIPLGLASDRIGRKPVIIAGLLIFALGSVISALGSESIFWIIIGRTMQGMGAIAAATMALAADLTREKVRPRVMAIIGMSIGIAFMVAMIVGPLLDAWAGLAGIFWVTMVLALSGVVLVVFVVPTPKQIRAHLDAGIMRGYLGRVVKNPALVRMDVGVFLLHLMMTANFLVLPVLFKEQLKMDVVDHWKVYLPVFLLSFLFIIPMIIFAEKYRQLKPLLLVSIVLLIIAEVLLVFSYDQQPVYWFIFAFIVFFAGFNFLEAVQPSLVAKYAAVDTKGTAMGVYNSAQFMGIFVGGALGGLINQTWGVEGIFLFNALLGFVWITVVWHLPQPQFYVSRVIRLDKHNNASTDWQQLHEQISAIRGVREVVIVAQEQLAYLKVDKRELDRERLRAISGASA